MKHTKFWIIAVALLLCAPRMSFGQAPGIYEDWQSGNIRPDRWTGSVIGQARLDLRREVQNGRLLLRNRGVGGPGLGSPLGGVNVVFKNGLAIDRLDVDFKAQDFELSGCDLDPNGFSVLFFGFTVSTFNDGASTSPNDLTGENFVNFRAYRLSNMPPGVLGIEGLLNRCGNSSCQGTIPFDRVDLGQISSDERFSLSFAWLRAQHTYVFRVRTASGYTVLSSRQYSANDNANAVSSNNAIYVLTQAADCSSSTTVADARVAVGDVRTNTSVIIP
jgi:hypothetical protein